MRKLLSCLLCAVVLFSCAKTSEVENLQKQIDELKSDQIATINSQIVSIQNSIGDLEGVDRELNNLISTLRENLTAFDGEVDSKYEEVSQTLGALERADVALDQRILDLKTHCEGQDEGVKTWVSATFSTLEQHAAVLTEIAATKTRLEELTQMIIDLDTTLSQKITDAETRLNAAIGRTENSIKGWVSEKLAGYYTIAQIDAKLQLLESGYTCGDEALSSEIATLRGNLETAKSDLTTAYQAAISTAIAQNDGIINAKIAADIQAATNALQSQIDVINGRLDSIESRISILERKVTEHIGMIQSIVVVPDYSDGSVKFSKTSRNKIRFEVYPLNAAEAIAENGPSIFSLDYVETITRSSESFVNLPVTSVSFTGKTLLLIVDGTGLSDDVFSGTSSANARLRIFYGSIMKSSEYFPLTITSDGTGEEPIPADAVDLGIEMTREDGTIYKLYWAKSNLSESGLCANPEDYGDYYAFGETAPKENYSWSTYKWGTSSTSLTKYNTKSSNGTVDNKTVLEPEDDVAHVKLGGKWRMPTDAEWTELRTKCIWTWVTNYNGSGINGRLVTASNGNSIFLPAAGFRDDVRLGNAGSYGHYWSSSLNTDFPDYAWYVYFRSVSVYRGHNNRYDGISLRPVYEE